MDDISHKVDIGDGLMFDSNSSLNKHLHEIIHYGNNKLIDETPLSDTNIIQEHTSYNGEKTHCFIGKTPLLKI